MRGTSADSTGTPLGLTDDDFTRSLENQTRILPTLPLDCWNESRAGCRGAVTVQAAGLLRKGRSRLGFRVGNREACVLLSVCEARTRYS
jgi:hypothetical protein